VAEVWHQEVNWAQARRVVLLRHKISDKQAAGQPREDIVTDQ